VGKKIFSNIAYFTLFQDCSFSIQFHTCSHRHVRYPRVRTG